MFLPCREPFSLTRTLRFVLSPPELASARVFPPLLDYFVEGEYRRAIDLGGEALLYGVREAEREGRRGVVVRVLYPRDTPAAREELPGIVARQFSVQLDLGPFHSLAANDPVLQGLVNRFRGMRIPQSPHPFEALVSAILEQQVNLTFAHQVKLALIRTYGEKIVFDGREYNVFPSSASLAIRTPRELRRIQVSGPKARYIIAIARDVLDGRLDLEGLREVPPEAARAKLLSYKGVGPWTAEYVGMRALGHLDCLPAADVGLQKVVKKFYGLREQPGALRLESIARPWKGWRSYATFYLWLTYWESPAWREQFAEAVRLKRPRARA